MVLYILCVCIAGCHCEWFTTEQALQQTEFQPAAASANLIVGAHVWLEDSDVAWIDGEVLEINGEQIKVLCTSGKTLLSGFLLESPNPQIMKRYILEVRYLKVMRTLLTDSSKNFQLSAFHIFKILVANPNKP
ncbi:unnamed protein product [Lathyrus sativus]|nr:unnamed protein product [Lathyrus sativus]